MYSCFVIYKQITMKHTSLYKNFIYCKETTTNQWKRNEWEKLANSHPPTRFLPYLTLG